MSLQAGIVGLPNIGKSTLFNAITRAGAEAANYPFCTIDPNVGVVEVPDARLAQLAEVVHPQRIVPTAFEFVDIAGLVKGASQGEGLGNQFLSHIREVDAICQVVRCFEDSDVTHVHGNLDPLRDIEVIHTELVLADLDTVEKRIEKTRRQAKGKNEQALKELSILEQLHGLLSEGQPARKLQLQEEDQKIVQGLHLLTAKPMLYVANVSEAEAADAGQNPFVQQVRQHAAAEGSVVVEISARLEAEIAELDEDERQLFLEDLGLEESGLDRLIRAAYELLGLITYFTAGEKEVRAWTVHRGATAPEAAGVIHSDFQRGFIRAEVVRWEDLVAAGSYAAVREKGLLRLEGKDYLVQDGDVMHFRFNV